MTKKFKTYVVKPMDIQRKWYLIDANGMILGRLVSQIARILMGKHKPYYCNYLLCGDYVVVINASKIKVTGKRLDQKIYYHHSGYPGGLKSIKLRELLAKKPERVLYKAIWGMLPKNKMGRRMLKQVKIYAGPEHPHQAQMPEKLEINLIELK